MIGTALAVFFLSNNLDMYKMFCRITVSTTKCGRTVIICRRGITYYSKMNYSNAAEKKVHQSPDPLLDLSYFVEYGKLYLKRKEREYYENTVSRAYV